MTAVRKNRYVITQQDFDKGYKTVVRRTQKDYNFYKWYKDYLNTKIKLKEKGFMLFIIFL